MSCGRTPRSWLTPQLALLALLWAAPLAPPLAAQLPTDTLRTPADTIPVDTIRADTLPPRELPRMMVAPPGGWATAVWIWDRDGFMGLRDLTLLELLEEIPGMIPLRGGDYGAPEAASALGFGGGRVRVFWDGFDQTPLDGGTVDLAMIGLAGVEELRVERGPGELRIYMESLRARDPRPFSLVEAGTGDTDTNFFRGSFIHPRVLGGMLGFALERVDTRGPFRRESGHRAGGWLSFTRPLGESFGVRAEARRISRDVNLNAFPVGLERTDYVLRGRGSFLDERLTAEVFTGGSSLESRADEPIVGIERSRRQHGLRARMEAGPAWGSASLRLLGGPERPSRQLELEGGGNLEGIGGGHARWSTEAWSERSASALSLGAWTAPRLGLSGFVSYATGVRGASVYAPYQPLPTDPEAELPEDPEPGQRFTDMTTLRVGGSFNWRVLALHGAWLRVEADSFPPMGFVLDRAGPVAPGGTFQGLEGDLRLALPIEGFALNASVQSWDEEARYLPKRSYQASIDFHDVFLETRNFEVWGALGVKGRDPMLVPQVRVTQEQSAQLQRVPFYQNWYLDVQVRVLPVHIFIRWENFILRENLQDFPERRLPITRAIYGVKWILWN